MEVYVPSHSKRAAKNPKLDLFNSPDADLSYLLENYQRVEATNFSPFNDNAIQFRVPLAYNFLDISDSFFRFVVNIRKKDGTILAATDKIAPENLFFHTFFSGVTVGINGFTFPSSTFQYPYQAWMFTLLQNGVGAKSSILSKEIYFPGNKMDDFSDDNKSFKARLELAKASKSFEMIGRPMHGLFTCEKFLPPSTKLCFEFRRSSPQVCLCGPATTTEYIIQLEVAEFYVRRVRVNPKISVEIMQSFRKNKRASYSFDNFRTNTVITPLNATSQFQFQKIVAGSNIVPKFVCLGVTSTDAFHGKFENSPFNFKTHDITSLKLTFESKPIVFEEMNFENGNYMLAYNTMCKLLPKFNGGNAISYEEWKDGSAIFVFDTQNLRGEDYSATRIGDIGLDIVFKTVPTKQLAIVVVSVEEVGIEISEDGLTDFVANKNILF
jgi:hypothetical protein